MEKKKNSQEFNVWHYMIQMILLGLGILFFVALPLELAFPTPKCQTQNFAGVTSQNSLLIIENGEIVLDLGTVNEYPWIAWSPDGKKVAFTSQENDGFYLNVYNTETDAVRSLGYGQAIHTEPLWSPDSNRVAYLVSPLTEDVVVHTTILMFYDTRTDAMYIASDPRRVSYGQKWLDNDVLEYNQSGMRYHQNGSDFLNKFESGPATAEEYSTSYCKGWGEYRIIVPR